MCVKIEKHFKILKILVIIIMRDFFDKNLFQEVFNSNEFKG
ncbi:unnamed protein product, partial [marine sediment metagenome]